uniref:Uncharacterized protein n=1 Tax=Kalanchoe fedtschenkoi TaxID=63787 RepID=A0A7N0RJM2_KALFE
MGKVWIGEGLRYREAQNWEESGSERHGSGEGPGPLKFFIRCSHHQLQQVFSIKSSSF